MEGNWEYNYSQSNGGPTPQGGTSGYTQNTQPNTNPAQDTRTTYNASYTELPHNEPGADPNFGGMPDGMNPEPPRRRRFPAGKIVKGAVALVLCAVVGFGGGYAGASVARNSNPIILQTAPTSDGGTAGTAASAETTAATVAAKVQPSVVEVTTEQVVMNSFLGQYVESGAGSGVILSADGYIITNNHVIEGASSITVRTYDGTEYPATLIGTDSQTDIAVLKIEAEGLTPAVIGDSDSVAVGDYVLAVGNPLGTLGGTVTDGIVSALDRDITVNGQNMTLMQTNAAVSPGNSGGGLFNANGELIGILNAKSADSEAEGIGFAIPIDTAIEVATDLMSNGYVTGRPGLGVTVISVSDLQTAMQYGLSNLGVYIQSVNSGSGAEEAGLKAGDRIVSVDGTVVNSTSDVTGVLDEHEIGDTVEVQVARDGQLVSAQVTLGERQATVNSSTSAPSSEHN